MGLIRYYGCYSNKARGQAGEQNPKTENRNPNAEGEGENPKTENRNPNAEGEGERTDDEKAARRRWAMLIQRVYQVDPLLCPKCGGTMKIISFVEVRQDEVIRKILEHCGLWHPPPRPAAAAPPSHSRPARPARIVPEADTGCACEIDPDYLEHLEREKQADQLELPWE